MLSAICEIFQAKQGSVYDSLHTNATAKHLGDKPRNQRLGVPDPPPTQLRARLQNCGVFECSGGCRAADRETSSEI